MSQPSPPRPSRTRPTEVQPLSRDELGAALLFPHLVIEKTLGCPDRLARNLVLGRHLGRVVAVLLVASLVYAIPFGAVPPVRGFWKVAVLFTGSVLICLPCLHVFGTYLGFQLSLASSFVLALVITGTAGLISFGLSPIVWFIDRTTDAAATSAVTPRDLAAALLGVALFMGIVQVVRCLEATRGTALETPILRPVLVLWSVLLVFITHRMAGLLEIL